MTCVFDCPKPVLVEDNLIATQLYLIAQEAVHNAVKHAQCQNIRISVESNRPPGPARARRRHRHPRPAGREPRRTGSAHHAQPCRDHPCDFDHRAGEARRHRGNVCLGKEEQ